MGFLGPVAASELGAVYNHVDQVLTLSASGDVQNFTYGFFFKRVAWAGGLRFELWGWSGPIGQGTSPFSYSQKFTIPNLLLNDPSNTVIVVTANNPTGKAVTINWTGFRPPHTAGGTTEVLSTLQDKLASNDDKPAPPPQTIDAASPLTVNTLFREPFDVSEKVGTALGATLHVDFDPQMLTLTEAGVDDGALKWTFNSLQTGLTQVVTYSTAGLGAPVIRKVYSVKVFVLDAATAAGDQPAQSLAVKNGNGNGNGISNGNGVSKGNGVLPHKGDGGAAPPAQKQILSFLGRVFEAQRIAQRVLPSARLLRVQATKPVGGPVFPVTDPLLLSQLDVLFTAATGNEYVTVKSVGWGEWAAPEVKTGVPVLGLQTFELDSVKVDVGQAARAIREAGDGMAFWEVMLAEPLGNPSEGPYEPLYSFRMVDTSIVAVDSVTGKVVT